MAQQATLEPGSALYELAQSVDLSKVPDKLICKSCQNFLLNGFKTACCEGSICESCNTASTGKPCPLCKHEPFFSNASKAVRGTARSYLKSLANADMVKTVDTTPVAPTPELKEVLPNQSRDISTNEAANNNGVSNGDITVQVESTQEPEDQAENVVQSIEEPKEIPRRYTMDSASGNDPDLDDDIEITVGTYEPSVPKERSQVAALDDRDQGWDAPQSHPPPPIRKGSTAQLRQEQSFDNSFGFDNNNGPNMDMPPTEAMMQMQMQNVMQMMQQNGMNPQNMPFLNNNPNPSPLQAQMQQMMQGFVANMAGMQSMGMPMMNLPGWGPGMNGFQNFQGMAPNMMGNGGGWNQAPQQYQQNYGDHRPSFNQRNGSFGNPARGRGKNRGRGRGGAGAYQHNQQDSYAYNNNMPFPNQFGLNQNQTQTQNQNHYNQGSINFSQPQYDHNSTNAYATNQSKDHEQPADDNDFAPGGQEEVEEALGNEYKRKTPTPVTEVKAEESASDVKNEYREEPATENEHVPTVESPTPQQEPEEKYIPEAYREDLGESYSAAPPSAPLGPSAKIVAFRERGHGRFPSRGRGSFHGSNGYAPRSPARPVSQHQTNSPTTNAGSGVIGAPTGPRAMREKDAPSAPIRTLTRAESDVGIKIRGTANQPRRDDTTRSATPKSAYDDYGDRDRDRDTTSRRHSKYDKKDDSRYSYGHSNSQNQGEYDEYESSRDKKRRKSRRDTEDDHYENDHDVQDTEMSEPQDRSTSHRERSRRDREREKEKTRDKYSSSTSKAHKTSSSRRHDDTYDDYDGANDYDPSDERTSRSAKKSSSKHDDREDRERKDRDYERAEKDKYRKRSRHDREREEDYEDADEEESRRRSRKHKREHTSSRKDRDRDRDRDRERDDSATDLGLRITGRSSKGGSGQAAVSEAPVADKDPHTLEREARNKERMLKEQQRRENAEKSKGIGLSGGRTRTFKYEDEIERSLGRSTKRR